MITLEEAKSLQYGDIVYHASNRNSDGSAQRWKVNGKVKTWKRERESNKHKVIVPVKHGLYVFDYLTENDLHLVYLYDPTVRPE